MVSKEKQKKKAKNAGKEQPVQSTARAMEPASVAPEPVTAVDSPSPLPPSAGPTITLCMIVRDEEIMLPQAIQSVRPVISEIIVVDTGSTDRTVEIAKELGAKVLHRAWDDDFSAPRNLSLEHATGDWILVLDADEAIAAEELEALKNLTSEPNTCWEFLQRHYSNDHRLSEFRPVTGEYPDWEKGNAGFFESNLVRFFPNRRGITYRGRVHELVEHSIREIPDLKIKRTQVRLQHYGHTDAVLAKKDKARLYTPLGEAKLKDEPKHWQAYFEMGVEHNRNGRHWESVTAFLHSLNLNPTYVPTWVNMGYVLCELGRYRQAEVSLMGALDIDPKSDEAFCNLGVVYMRSNRMQQAEQSFRRAIELNQNYVNAYCNLGKTFALTKRIPEAVAVYRRVLQIMPQCAVAKADLGAIYLSNRMFVEAEVCLREAIQHDPSMTRVLFHLGQLYRATGRAVQAVESLEKFCAFEESRLKDVGAPEQVRFIRQVRSETESYKRQLGAA